MKYDQSKKIKSFWKKKVVCNILDLGKSEQPELNEPPFQRPFLKKFNPPGGFKGAPRAPTRKKTEDKNRLLESVPKKLPLPIMKRFVAVSSLRLTGWLI